MEFFSPHRKQQNKNIRNYSRSASKQAIINFREAIAGKLCYKRSPRSFPFLAKARRTSLGAIHFQIKFLIIITAAQKQCNKQRKATTERQKSKTVLHISQPCWREEPIPRPPVPFVHGKLLGAPSLPARPHVPRSNSIPVADFSAFFTFLRIFHSLTFAVGRA